MYYMQRYRRVRMRKKEIDTQTESMLRQTCRTFTPVCDNNHLVTEWYLQIRAYIMEMTHRAKMHSTRLSARATRTGLGSSTSSRTGLADKNAPNVMHACGHSHVYMQPVQTSKVPWTPGTGLLRGWHEAGLQSAHMYSTSWRPFAGLQLYACAALAPLEQQSLLPELYCCSCNS